MDLWIFQIITLTFYDFFEGGMCRYKHFPVYCTTTDKTNEKSSQWRRVVEHNSHNPCHKSPFLTPVIFSCILLWWHHRNFIDTKLLWNPQRRPGLWWAQRTLAWYWSGFYYPLFFFFLYSFYPSLRFTVTASETNITRISGGSGKKHDAKMDVFVF